jgi:integrase/recombinase XerC
VSTVLNTVFCSIATQRPTLRVRHGKGGRSRTVPLNADARNALAALGSPELASTRAPVLTGQRGPLTPRGGQARFAQYRLWSQLDNLSPHTCRHTFRKNLLDVGVAIEKVAAFERIGTDA